MLTKTKIEYLTHCWNFFEGCLNTKEICPVRDDCWARTCAKMGRLTDKEFRPHLIPERLLDPLKGYNPQKPRRIGVCFTGDLFGDWVDPATLIDVSAHPLFGENLKYGKNWHLSVIISDVMFSCPTDTFIFLTKNLVGLVKWSPFPENAWVGVSAWDAKSFIKAGEALEHIKAAIRLISVEPLLSWEHGATGFIATMLKKWNITWLIIGQQTPANKKTEPRIEWIKEIVVAADRAGIPVFLKDNLKPLLKDFEQPWAFSDGYYTSDEHPNIDRHLRQEYPK